MTSYTDNEFNGARTAPTQTIKVIGVGGGGNNAVNHMYEQGIKDVSFILINTDKQVLESSGIPTKLVIGPGRGAGGKPEKARQFAEDNIDQINALFDDHTDMVFVTAGMGGGTGTGAAPVVARAAKELGILTVGIVTIPFKFEGKQKVRKAMEGALEMGKNVDALLIINNQRLTEIYPDFDILTAFAKADDTLLVAAQGITDIITITGKINRDFNDVDTALRDGGTAIISTGVGTGENRVTDAINNALASPLLKNTDIRDSKKILMVLYISDNPENRFETRELEEFTNFVQEINEDVDVMWGLYAVPDLDKDVKVTILASGFNVTVEETQHRQPEPAKKPAAEPEKTEVDTMIETEYGPGSSRGFHSSGNKGLVISPDQLDSDEVIEEAERPALSRTRRAGNRIAPPAQSAPKAPQAEKKTDTPAKPGIMFNDFE